MNRTNTQYQNPLVEGSHSCSCIELLRKSQQHVDGGGLMSQEYLYFKCSQSPSQWFVERQNFCKTDPFKNNGQNMSKFSWYWEISIGISQEYVLENSPAIHKETQKKWRNKDMKKFSNNQISFRMARNRDSCQRTL